MKPGNWQQLPDGDTHDEIGPMLMLTPGQGWMVSGGANNELLVTRDGAKTWQRIELESPVKTDQMREYDRNLEQLQRLIAGTKLASMQPPQHPSSYAAYDLPHSRIPSTATSALPIWSGGVVRHRGRRCFLEAG